MVFHNLPDSRENWAGPRPSTDAEGDCDSGIEDELRPDGGDSTIFLAFKGDVDDKDFKQKLEKILENVPNLISMESNQMKVQKVEPWNSVRVTFNIPREAAERLRLLAQGNNQQLRDLGILSVQIEGEGAINLALSQNRGHEVRMNGPMGANSTMRLDAGFQMQGATGLIRMNNPAAIMSQGPHVSTQMMSAGSSTDPQTRAPRPSSQQDAMDTMGPGLAVQQQSHPSGSLGPQLHPMQTVIANRTMTPANFQQFQQQSRLPQHQQVSQGLRPSFAAPAQVPVPPGWNQLASGALQPPPAQGSIGTVASNQGWKKSPMGGPMQQQLFPQRPSLATVQTPSHPPPPYPFGSQQASQAHANFPSLSNPNQFSSSSMKPLQGGPARVATPMQQSHLTSKSPTSSPSSSAFQQGSPASSPTVSQVQQAMGSRSGQGNSMPQGFQQQQSVSSPNRSGMMQQGNTGGSFMMQQAQQQGQGPQGIHAGVTKRLMTGFQAGQANTSYLQGQTPPSATGSPANGGATQQQGNGNGQGTGGQANGSSHNPMQGSHGGPNLMQTNIMGLHGNLNNQQAGSSGVNQVNMVSLHGQSQQGAQSQLLNMHQQIISQGQMVNIQGQAPVNTQGQLVLSRTQLMPQQGQMLGASQNQNLGQAPQRITTPKQMIPSHNQMMVSQGQAMMQQNPVMEQIMQGNKQGFNTQNPSGNMAGPSQINRGPNPNMPGNMVQFSGQAVSQQGTINNNPSQGVSMQGQVLRPTGPSQHLQQQQQHGDNTSQSGGELSSMLPELSMQQASNMASQHMQNIPGNGGPGQHFSGHGLSFSSPFAQGGSGNQMACGQNSAFPVNKDVTLTSPLLVNLLQSDISAGHFGVNNKQNNSNAIKPKKKKPPRKKKVPPGEEQMSVPEPRMEESEQAGLSGEQGTLETVQKLPEFNSRPPGYPPQPVEQRSLQQIPPQLMQLGQQQGQGGQPQPPQQQMMMMLMMQQQQQQQDQKPVRLPMQQNVFNSRAALNADAQRMPIQQGGNLPVMVNLQGSNSIPPSPDKQRMSMAASGSLGSNGRKMSFPDSGHNPSGSPLGDVSSSASLTDASELPAASGSQGNMASHLLISQNQLMMTGSKPGAPSSLSLTQGASPQQHTSAMPGPHGHHFQSVSAQSQTSRPKTPNRASPRPYYPQTPNNRPPSTEPSEISLSPERLNASIAGLFPPQINIPLPPRPTLNRCFDQQGLNPTTLKAIGQAPPGLTVSNTSGFVPSHMNKMDNVAGKQSNAGGNKRASPSNSRRSSPGSSRKTTPSPGRQNPKTPKFVLGAQQSPGLLHNIEMARNALVGQSSVQPTPPGLTIGQYPPMSMPVSNSPADETKGSPPIAQDSDIQPSQMVAKEHQAADLRPIMHQEIKRSPSEEKGTHSVEISKSSYADESRNVISPAMREAPTSLSQLLDHSSAPNVTIKPSGSLNESSPVQSLLDDAKKSEVRTPPLETISKDANSKSNFTPSTIAEQCTTQTVPDMAEPNTSVPLNLPGSTMKRPVGPTSMSAPLPPNQITVFVTSNPITSSANVSAPITSHLQPTLVSTVVTMPNVGNKVIVTEGQQAAQSNARPQFITPVFINPSSIIQVMKGSQQGNLPASTIAPNNSLMSQSVAVVGPLHISPNIQFSSGPPSSTAPSSTVSNLPSTRPVLINTVQTTTQLTPSSSPSSHPPNTPQPRDSHSEDTNSQLGTAPDQCHLASAQPTASPSFDSTSSPSTVNKKSSVVSSKNQSKVDKIGQLLLTKACKKVTSSSDGATEEDHSETTGNEAVETNYAGKTSPPFNTTPPETNNITTVSSDPGCPALNTTVDVPPTATSSQPTIPGGQSSQGGIISEQTGTSLEKEHMEHPPEKVSSQSASQEEDSVSEEAVPEKAVAESEQLENSEIEPAERSRPPSRRNSKAEECTAPQEIMESGQRKRSARPSTASNSMKEPGASPPQPKRRKSK